jgi:hypothetical protein
VGASESSPSSSTKIHMRAMTPMAIAIVRTGESVNPCACLIPAAPAGGSGAWFFAGAEDSPDEVWTALDDPVADHAGVLALANTNVLESKMVISLRDITAAPVSRRLATISYPKSRNYLARVLPRVLVSTRRQGSRYKKRS